MLSSLTNPIRKAPLLPPVYRWGYWSTESKSSSPVTQPERGKARIWTQRDWLQSLTLNVDHLVKSRGKLVENWFRGLERDDEIESQNLVHLQSQVGLSLTHPQTSPETAGNLAMRGISSRFLLTICSIQRQVISWPLHAPFYLSHRCCAVLSCSVMSDFVRPHGL